MAEGLEFLVGDLGEAGLAGIDRHPQPHQRDPAEVDRVEDHRRRFAAMIAENLGAEREQHDPGEVEDVERQQSPVEAGDAGEEAVMVDPVATDHGEADRVGDQVVSLVPERVGEGFVSEVLGDAQGQHQQRDRDREDAVAEGNDAGELDLVAIAPARVPRPRHPGIIADGRDGIVPRGERLGGWQRRCLRTDLARDEHVRRYLDLANRSVIVEGNDHAF